MNLQILWFCVIAFFWSGYFVLEGFDFGVGMLLPFLPGDEREREAMFQSIGPVWDGNEVWLVVVGGATFAAFPAWYGTMFSGFYLALLLVLVCLIVRVLSFEWRTKGRTPGWRTVWTWANTLGSVGASFVWGVGLSALLYGVPIDSSSEFTGDLADLFNGYTVLGGLTVVLLFAYHGATYLGLRTTGDLCARADHAARRLSFAATLVGAGFLAWTVEVAVDHNNKTITWPLLVALLGIAALVVSVIAAMLRRSALAFAFTGLAVLAWVATIFTSLYPRVMVSSTDFNNSLTVTNASSAHYTLAVMSVVALICVPLILLYQGWTYHVFRERIAGAPCGGGDAHDSAQR
jgi:cytochrome bd ubiquinol oxidase subunit II